jgi:hypothetical protein
MEIFYLKAEGTDYTINNKKAKGKGRRIKKE